MKYNYQHEVQLFTLNQLQYNAENALGFDEHSNISVTVKFIRIILKVVIIRHMEIYIRIGKMRNI